MRIRHYLSLLALAWPVAAQPIVIRHDVADAKYLADEADYPFLFALYHPKSGPDCIATLIAPQWAVTAAHCTEDKPLLAALATGKPGYRVELAGGHAFIDRVERHPGLPDGKKIDLALVHLTTPVAKIRPVTLHRDGDELGRVVLLPGWGGTGNGRDGLGASDGRFRVAENRVDAARDGVLLWTFDDPRGGIGRALPLEGISGPGDSGGPALIMTSRGWAITGISMAQRTFGRPEGVYNAEEIYVRVSDHAGWIDGVIAPPRP